MFAPAHHGATRHVVPVRKELAVRTIFNFLGPLTNPAGASRQVIGVSDPAFLLTIAGALARLGARKALVVSSADGLDEMSTAGTTTVVEVDGNEIHSSRGRSGGRRPASKYLRGHRRRHPAAQRRGHAPHLRRRGRPDARPRGAQRGRRDLRRGPGGHARGGRAGGRAGARLGRRRRGARHAGRADATIGPVLNVLERIVGSTREELERRRRAVPLSQLEAALDDGPRAARSARRSRAPASP